MSSVNRSQDLKELKEYLLEGIKTVEPRAIECISGTRTTILADVVAKTDDHDGPNVICIRGAPGSGKSSISLSTKSRLRRQGRLITYFRFDRNEAATTTTTSLWRIVACDLGRRFPSIRTQLLQCLRDDTVDLDSPMELFTSLIEDPLSEYIGSIDDPLKGPPVIIIDALDECGGLQGRLSADRKALLQTLQRWPQLPKFIKLVVTSRDEGDIPRILSPISTLVDIPSGNSLTDNPHAASSIAASADIQTFLEGRFMEIREPLPSLPPGWPGSGVISKMVHWAAGNFMWVTTATNFVDSGLNPQDQLDSIMNHSSKSLKPLYSLYSAILDTSFGSAVGDDSGAEVLRAVLGTIVFSQRPLEAAEYTKLPTMKPVERTTVELIRDRLRSVIDKGSTLRFVHKSFDDFLLSDECPFQYKIKMDECQDLLTRLCLMTMTNELRFNICDLETSCLKNVDVPDIDTKVSNSIPPLLSYSCCFWADHLSLTPFDEELMTEVKDMIWDKMLYLFEAMSLLKEFYRVSHSLLLALKWFHTSPDEEIKEFLRDARQFIGAFGQPIAQSAPHIYISALPFAPEHSLVARHFLARFPHVFILSSGKPAYWPACVFTAEHHNDEVYSVVFSSDEKRFASGSRDGTVCICDSETGSLIFAPFRLLAGLPVTRVFYDPDGRNILASYESDHGSHLICWEIETGDKRFDFRQYDLIGFCRFNGRQCFISLVHSDQVGSCPTVSWSCLQTGKQLHVKQVDIQTDHIRLSPDGRHIVWLNKRNSPRVSILKIADGRIEPVTIPHDHILSDHSCNHPSFAVDSDFAMVVCHDKKSQDDHVSFYSYPDSFQTFHGLEVAILDATNGSILHPSLAISAMSVNAVAYSHEKTLVVAATDKKSTVTVWNASTNEAVPWSLNGHTSYIHHIAMSRDGRKVLTASADKTVRMWDLSRTESLATYTEEPVHSGHFYDIIFSPCATKLVSLSEDYTILIRDANTGKPLLNPIKFYSNYTRITFSPDGSQIVAYGSDVDTIRMWNVGTGKLVSSLQLGDDIEEGWPGARVNHLAFRSIDERLITCSNNGILCIWSWNGSLPLIHDLSTTSGRTTVARQDVAILALSSDGLTAIVRDDNRCPRHYVWSTTTCQPLPLTFVDDEHASGNGVEFSYSPNGQLLAATHTLDTGGVCTLRVWNAHNGELVAGFSTLGGQICCLVFSPNDRHVAFVYNDSSTSIQIWDFTTGHLASGPWVGHVSPIDVLAFSPAGDKMASGSVDGQIRIWNAIDLLGDSQIPLDTLPTPVPMQDGWVTDQDGKLYFWVPKDHRDGLGWERNTLVIGGEGIQTRLDLTNFRFGTNWAQCIASAQ